MTANTNGSPELGRHCGYYEGNFPPQAQINNAGPGDTPSITRFAGRQLLAYRNTSGEIRMIGTTADFATCETSCANPLVGCDTWPDSYQVATVFRFDDTHKWLQFAPKADGFVNTVYKDTNDFVLLERGLCSGLRNKCDDSFCKLTTEADSCPARH